MMVYHTYKWTNCLGVFGHFVGLALKRFSLFKLNIGNSYFDLFHEVHHKNTFSFSAMLYNM